MKVSCSVRGASLVMGRVLYLVLSLLALGVGPLAYRVAGRGRSLPFLDGLVVICVAVLVLVEIMPHAVRHAGWVAMAPMLLGLLGPTLAERWRARAEVSAHGFVLWLVAIGLSIHALLDGVALRLPTGDTEVVALPLAVVLHRVPASLVVWRVLLEPMGARYATAVLSSIGILTVVGYVAAAPLFAVLPETAIAMVEALVGGSLLHIVVHARHSHSH